METFASREEYLAFCEKQAVLPEGFSTAVAKIKFFPKEMATAQAYPMNMSLILLDEPTPSFFGMFTSNAFCGAPVTIGRKRIKEKLCRGFIINNKISNVAVAGGEEDALAVVQALGKALGAPPEQFFPSSTGIIGWHLPVKEMTEAVPVLTKNLVKTSLLPVAQAIMTTDSFPKVRSERCGAGIITGTAKGAGMIEPNMGTMLGFILTDIAVDRKFLAESLKWAVSQTFNRISIDGDQSTSDMVLFASSNKKPLADPALFKEALLAVCQKLSESIVRNGEGVQHVIRVLVKNAQSEETAIQAGKAIVNSPLVKTAIFGNDANVGRVIGALGDYFGNAGKTVSQEKLSLKMGETVIFSNNGFTLDNEKEKILSGYLKSCSYTLEHKYPPHDRTVDITVDFNNGSKEATVYGADLSYDYVKENGAYRS